MTPQSPKMLKRLSSRCLLGRAPAKLNLFFEIQGRRPDGYHDVCSLCCPISLYDTIIFETDEVPQVKLTCESGDVRRKVPDVPDDGSNIIVKAVEEIRRRYGIATGCRIRLIKRIPSQAGMGGGSSDAATAIRLADAAWGLRLSTDEMKTIGATLGSDVPLFFVDGMSIGHGRGEWVEPVGRNPRMDFVVIKPPEGISTAEAFRQCAAGIANGENIGHNEMLQSPDALVRGLQERNPGRIASGIFNRLEATARRMCPSLRRIRDLFARLDCPAHQMTGSGTAYFAICRNDRHARQLAMRLRQQRLGDVFVVHSLY